MAYSPRFALEAVTYAVRSRQLLPDSLSEPPLEHGTIAPIARRPQDETSWGRFFWVMLRCEIKDSSPACKKARIRPITGGVRRGQMVREFVKTALEGDKEDVAEHEQALLLKTFRASRSTLQLARRTARETRVTMALAAVAVALLILAIYMLSSGASP